MNWIKRIRLNVLPSCDAATSLTSLPPELIWDIGRFVSNPDLSALILTSTFFANVLTPQLYNNVFLKDAVWNDGPPPHRFSQAYKVAAKINIAKILLASRVFQRAAHWQSPRILNYFSSLPLENLKDNFYVWDDYRSPWSEPQFPYSGITGRFYRPENLLSSLVRARSDVVVNFLVERILPSERLGKGFVPWTLTYELTEAIRINSWSMAHRLMNEAQSGAVVVDPNKDSVLHCLVSRAYFGEPELEAVKHLLEIGASVNVKGHIPLLHQVSRYEPYSDNPGPSSGSTVLEFAIRQFKGESGPRLEMIKLVINLTKDCLLRDRDDHTLLHLVAMQKPQPREAVGGVQVIQALISRGIDVNARNRWGKAPIHYAARSNNNIEVLKALIANGADVDATYSRGATQWTPLRLAINTKASEALIVLLISEANISFYCRGKEKHGMLHRAAEMGRDEHFEIFAMLNPHRRTKKCNICTKKMNELMDKGELPGDLLA